MRTKRKTIKTAIKQAKAPMPIQRRILRQFALLEPVFDFFCSARLVAFFAMPQISVFWTAYRVQQREPRVEVMKNSSIRGQYSSIKITNYDNFPPKNVKPSVGFVNPGPRPL